MIMIQEQIAQFDILNKKVNGKEASEQKFWGTFYVSGIVLKQGLGTVWGSMTGAITRIPFHSLSLKTIEEQSMAS